MTRMGKAWTGPDKQRQGDARIRRDIVMQGFAEERLGRSGKAGLRRGKARSDMDQTCGGKATERSDTQRMSED